MSNFIGCPRCHRVHIHEHYEPSRDAIFFGLIKARPAQWRTECQSCGWTWRTPAPDGISFQKYKREYKRDRGSVA